jgi:hypothetical protein
MANSKISNSAAATTATTHYARHERPGAVARRPHRQAVRVVAAVHGRTDPPDRAPPTPRWNPDRPPTAGGITGPKGPAIRAFAALTPKAATPTLADMCAFAHSPKPRSRCPEVPPLHGGRRVPRVAAAAGDLAASAPRRRGVTLPCSTSTAGHDVPTQRIGVPAFGACTPLHQRGVCGRCPEDVINDV